MKNAEWCIKNNIHFKDLCCGPTCLGSQGDQIGYYNGFAFHVLYRGKRLGLSFAESILTWLDMEHKEEEVLDSTEKLYLASIIRPFRRRVALLSVLLTQMMTSTYHDSAQTLCTKACSCIGSTNWRSLDYE